MWYRVIYIGISDIEILLFFLDSINKKIHFLKK
jgi:hypothetical protein